MEREDTSAGVDKSVQHFKFIKGKLTSKSVPNVKPRRNYAALKTSTKLNNKIMKVKKLNFLELVKSREKKAIKIIPTHKLILKKTHSKLKLQPSNTQKS